jgi:hypothetical protein
MSRQGPDGRWYSDDGRFIWDGQVWQPVPSFATYGGAEPEGMVPSIEQAFSTPFRDQEWVAKMVVQALILLIPIVGTIALWGWMLKYMDNLARGRPELPAAGFHLGRGVQLFVPLFVWGLVVAVPSIVLYVASIVMVVNETTSPNAYPTSGGLQPAGAFGLAAWTVLVVLGLLLMFVYPALYTLVWREGIAGGFQIGRIVSMSFGNPVPSLTAAVLMIAANCIASLGAIFCFVGCLFTTVMAMAFIGGFISWFAGQVPVPANQP